MGVIGIGMIKAWLGQKASSMKAVSMDAGVVEVS